MTREEAKMILEEVKIMDDSMYQYNTKYLEALDMAIKALEQEPTTHGYMLVCPNCGLDVHSDFKTCPRCGAKMKEGCKNGK